MRWPAVAGSKPLSPWPPTARWLVITEDFVRGDALQLGGGVFEFALQISHVGFHLAEGLGECNIACNGLQLGRGDTTALGLKGLQFAADGVELSENTGVEEGVVVEIKYANGLKPDSGNLDSKIISKKR